VSTTPERILSTYVVLTLLSTLASSFIWGINTLFLLDAGLSVGQAFAANAFFTAGEVIFEVPTGVVADTWGRRISYLLGAGTLLASTLLYLLMWRIRGPFWAWALSSALLGLGFTFFSGATEAWLVDGLRATRYGGTLESAFAKGQMANGAGMLTGAIAGGVVAQATSLGVPYLLRAVTLGLTFLVASIWMRDVGFTPKRSASVVGEMRDIVTGSLEQCLRNPPVRWMMLAGVFGSAVSIYGFYAMQPYLLELHGRKDYAIAGVAAALAAAGQIVGALVVPWTRKVFRRRTSALLFCAGASTAALLTMGLASHFWVVLAALGCWSLVFAAALPIRQAFLNEIIPSERRATVLSSDNLLGSAGAAVAQPPLGRVAEVWGYATSYVAAAGVQILALPILLLARGERAPSDPIPVEAAAGPERAGQGGSEMGARP
jgi:MFS family permease